MRYRFLFFLVSIGFFFSALKAQRPLQGGVSPVMKPYPKHHISARAAAEVCGNNIDDDGNGLIDCVDYGCYFNTSSSTCNCMPIDVVWVCTGIGELYWVDHQNGTERFVGSTAKAMTDISWTVDGKLYGVDWLLNKLWVIDPLTAQPAFVSDIAGYDASNAMTSDASGNLFIASRQIGMPEITSIIKMNPVTGQITSVASIPFGEISAGDLAFANGYLYMTCKNNKIAKININNGAVSISTINGLPFGANIYGIVSKADGTLYLGDNGALYKLNLTTMQATLHYTCSTSGINIWGMANFNDYCMAPVCRAKVEIDIQTPLPYCSSPGVLLKASGTGVIDDSMYVWRLPDGTTLTTQSIFAKQSGKYIVRYSSIPDTCGWEDSITIDITKNPAAFLQGDTTICSGTQIVLQPSSQQDITSYLWQNGSTAQQLEVTSPGLYWLQTSNACGFFRDSILIKGAAIPKVNLGADREACEYDTVHLKNFLDSPGYKYKWSNSSSSDKFAIINSPGTYWVDVTNICGTVSDTVIVNKKIDDCECFLYVPSAFTPNNDGKNDIVKVLSNCPVQGEFFIYNRWGQLVFYTKDLGKGWSGLYKSQQQNPGVFVFQIKYKYEFRPGIFYKKGTFTLIR